MDLYVLKYNNYYNRIVKREVDLSSYLTAGTLIHTQYNVNYAPGDGVNMRQVLNSETYGDYAIYADGNTIVSRWFIIEASRNCKGQFGLTLRRDLVVDNFDTVLNADCFIEKAILPDNDPMIFNKENMTVNQIKTSVNSILDSTGYGYIVGYVDKSFQQTEHTIPKDALATIDTLEGFNSVWNSSKNAIFDINSFYPTYKISAHSLGGDFAFMLNQYKSELGDGDAYSGLEVSTEDIIPVFNKLNNIVDYSALANALGQDTEIPIRNINNILKYDGKIVLDTSSNVYYKLTISGSQDNYEYNVPASGTTYNALKSLTDQTTMTGTPTANAFKVLAAGMKYTYIKTPVSVASYKYTIAKDRQSLTNQFYDMFVIPFERGVDQVNWKVGNTLMFYSPDVKAGLAVANDLISENSVNGKLKDIQILPYFPMPSLVGSGAVNLPDDTYVSKITDDNGKVLNAIIWCNQNKFEFTSNNTILTKDTKYQSSRNDANLKIANECSFIRLVAPTKQAVFEYNPAKNRNTFTASYSSFQGFIEHFKVKCTYKPYQPFVQIMPTFGGLYGNNNPFDERGLIFSGDFSMTQGSDAWTQYKRQNVNYLNIFDRQIQNMETTYEKQRASNIVGGVASAIGAGAGIGSLVGGKVAGPIAGLLSAGASIGGMLGDLAIQDQLQNEALDYKRDMFNYQLGNIKALPDTLSKVDAFTNTFSVFPMVEYYTCTDEEKKAVANKIAYNSMSVGRIGKIKDFIGNKWSYGDITSKGYIKGSLIRVDIDEDTQYINELANEIYKGVYF